MEKKYVFFSPWDRWWCLLWKAAALRGNFCLQEMIHQASAWTWGQKAKCLVTAWTKGYHVLTHKAHVASVTEMKQQHMEYEAYFWHIPFIKLLVNWIKWCGIPAATKTLSESLQKIPGLLVDTQLDVSQQYVLHTKVLKDQMCSGLQVGGIIPLHSALGNSQLCPVQGSSVPEGLGQTAESAGALRWCLGLQYRVW